jgi:MYXO-CTERM domain-containing protein
MKSKTTPHAGLASLVLVAVVGMADQSHSATLLTPGAVQVEYTLGESGLDWISNFQTDASGNGRTMALGGNNATWDRGGIAPGSTKAIFVNSTTVEGNGGAQAYVMNNTAGMPSDFQVSIFLATPGTFGGANSDNGAGYVFTVGDLSLRASGNVGTQEVTYSAFVGASQVGTITVGGAEVATGLLVQKVGNTFSFWTSLNTGASWTQQGSDLTDPVASIPWESTHLFIKPGGGNQYSGYADDFKVSAVVPVPEPGAALLGGLGMLALLRRRRA